MAADEMISASLWPEHPSLHQRPLLYSSLIGPMSPAQVGGMGPPFPSYCKPMSEVLRQTV